MAIGGSPEASQTLAEIGALLVGLGVIAFIAARLKFSVVPLYLIVGLAVGQGGFGLVNLSSDFLAIGAQIGAILLLLLLGLEYSAPDLAKAFKDRKLWLEFSTLPQTLSLAHCLPLFLAGGRWLHS